MKKRFKLGIIGCDVMAQGIIRRIVDSEFIRHTKIVVYSSKTEELEQVDDVGVYTTDDCEFVASNCEYVLLAVKGSEFDGIAAELKAIRPEKIISIIPNLSKNTIKNSLGVGVMVARAVVSMACTIGCGAFIVDMVDFTRNKDDVLFLSFLGQCLGGLICVEESKLNVAAAISLSTPAYMFMLADTIADIGVKLGLSETIATQISIQSMFGAGQLLATGEQSISELLMSACGRGSGVLAGLKVIEEENMLSTIENAISACKNKTDELLK